MVVFQHRISVITCSTCSLSIPIKKWREHHLQHEALKILQLNSYPTSFEELSKHFKTKLAAAERRHQKCFKAKLIKAYDTLKLLYFKEYKRQEERPGSPSDMPSFKKMIRSLDPPNFSYNSCQNKDSQEVLLPSPFGFSCTIIQHENNIFNVQEIVKRYASDNSEHYLWCSGFFEGLNGSPTAKYLSQNYLTTVKDILENNQPEDITKLRSVLKRSLHEIDGDLKTLNPEVKEQRWSGSMGVLCFVQTSFSENPEILKSDEHVLKFSNNIDNLQGLLHVMNFGTGQAILCSNGSAYTLSATHSTSNRREMKKVLERGGFITPSGLVNSITRVTRAVGFHGDAKLRAAMSRNPHFQTVALSSDDEFIIIGNSNFFKYMGAEEACNLCHHILQPSLKMLIYNYVLLQESAQEEAMSQVSTLNYDALVSDFGDSKESSMIPDDESEGRTTGLTSVIQDPLELLKHDNVSILLAQALSNALIDGVKNMGAVGPLACSVLLLKGAEDMVKRRLYAEQVKYELESRLEDTTLSQVSLMSFPHPEETIQISFDEEIGGQHLCPLSKEVISEYKNEEVPSVSRVLTHASPTRDNIAVAKFLALDPGHLVYEDSAVLRLKRMSKNAKYDEIDVSDLNLYSIDDDLAIQEKRDKLRDMVTLAVQKNAQQKPEAVVPDLVYDTKESEKKNDEDKASSVGSNGIKQITQEEAGPSRHLAATPDSLDSNDLKTFNESASTVEDDDTS